MSVLVPMAFGLAAAVLLYEGFAPEGVAFPTFALFMASAMSITAFPIMARILKERGMTHSLIGRLSLTSAAMADVLAWIMLALVVVLADAREDWSRFWQMLGRARRAEVRSCSASGVRCSHASSRGSRRDGRPEGSLLAVLLIGTFACAYATKWLGVHPVFGAFLFGVALPRDDRLLEALIERVEYVAIIVLMPVFFALAGLNTTPSAFVGAGFTALLIVLVAAVAGKVLGGAIGARIAGYPWRTALAVGSLMNARALMELIVMKVGLDAGVIGRDLFTMLMVMAIVTTFMTGPLLTLFAGQGEDQVADASETTARP